MSVSVMHSVDIIPSRDTVFVVHHLSQKTQLKYTVNNELDNELDGLFKHYVFMIHQFLTIYILFKGN